MTNGERFFRQSRQIFAGGLGTDQMGAVTVAFPLGQIVVGLGLLFGNGAAAYLSRLLGRGGKDTANKVASTAIYSGVSIGAVVILLSVIFLEPILKQAGASKSVMPYAITYSDFNLLALDTCHMASEAENACSP